MDDLLSDFLTESAEHIEMLDDRLLGWERDPSDRALLNDIFRLMHTIKGTCGFLDLPRLEALTHAAENVLGRVRDEGRIPAPAVVVAIIETIDAIKCALAALGRTGRESDKDHAALIAALHKLAEEDTATDMFCDSAADMPADVFLDAAPAGAAPFSPARAQPPPLSAMSAAVGATIRISVDLLEQMVNAASELVLTRNQLLQIARDHPDDAYGPAVERLSAQVGILQDCVLHSRMQPVASAWSALPRMVRDLAAETGKQVILDLAGGETELDRQVIELIKDPLAHMIRNAVDHGIETPALRQARGKPQAGRIRLDAYQAAGQVVIEMTDDGGGIDTDRLRTRAIQRGLVDAADADRMTMTQLERLIFLPGLSTAAQVSGISGRGVGMDVVKANVERIGGTIDLESRSGQGTRFRLRIPLTLAIMPTLIVVTQGHQFALPQACVREIVEVGRPGRPQVERIGDVPVLRFRDQLLPLVALGQTLGLSDAEEGARHVVVVQAGEGQFGLLVDALAGSEEVVVKPVPPLLGNAAVYAGNAIFGDGLVRMIIDIPGLATRALSGVDSLQALTPPLPPTLVAEPSETLLLFMCRARRRHAVRLLDVTRIERVDCAQVSLGDDRAFVACRGALLPLIEPDGAVPVSKAGYLPCLVFEADGKAGGLIVEEVLDIVAAPAPEALLPAENDPHLLGMAMIAGEMTRILDPLAMAMLVAEQASPPGGGGSQRTLLETLEQTLRRRMA